MDIHATSIMTPIGDLTCFEENEKIIVLEWGQAPNSAETPLLREAKSQLSAYFKGQLRRFDLPLGPHGTDHQQKVWAAMGEIAFGRTISYGEIAQKIKSSPRAVGGACGKNPIPIIIPCHRVVGAQGKMTGYSGAGGVETKIHLLRMEAALANS